MAGADFLKSRIGRIYTVDFIPICTRWGSADTCRKSERGIIFEMAGTLIAQDTIVQGTKKADNNLRGGFMSEHIYKQIELTGSSKTSMEDAIQNAIAKASKTLHNLDWFQVVESRGHIQNNKIDYWQVTIKLGFRLDD
jgi:flavin-binding protein dodecin